MGSVSNPDDFPRIIGGYELLGLIGKGGMGSVYKAKSPAGEFCAVKVLAPHLTHNEVQLKRFYQEARLAMRLDHPNLVRALDVGEDRGHHFFAMELIDGESVGDRLKRTGRLFEKEANHIIMSVARALHKAHNEGLVHRDVKPDNILITRDRQVKLADMGLAKELNADLNLTKTGRGLGTPHFMAPEQFRNAKNADARCDVYSLGATLYMMLTGELPFRGASPLDTFMKKSSNDYVPVEELNPTLSPSTIAAVRFAMDPDPDLRPESCRAFVELLNGKSEPPNSGPVPVAIQAAALAAIQQQAAHQAAQQAAHQAAQQAAQQAATQQAPAKTSPERASVGPSSVILASPSSSGSSTGSASSRNLAEEAAEGPYWYVVFTDVGGQKQKVKGRVAAISQQIRRGRIGLDACASLEKAGPFLPLRELEPFRNLVRPLEGRQPEFVDSTPSSLARAGGLTLPTPGQSGTRLRDGGGKSGRLPNIPPLANLRGSDPQFGDEVPRTSPLSIALYALGFLILAAVGIGIGLMMNRGS
ncbi:MAG: serine/threonine-protein kinase [Planctomycetia bacterium]